MEQKVENSIKKTKEGFEKSFLEGNLYDRQTQDRNHLNKIMECLHIKSGNRILDLGTGSGYLAFEIARKYPDSMVIGLDIVENALKKNREQAKTLDLNNISFASYGGVEIPFDSSYFDIVVTRYTLHHFPQIEESFREISRILKNNGKFFLADPTPNYDDTERFVDAYMQMKKDGHIKYYTKEEFKYLACQVDMKLIEDFETSITFPKKKVEAIGFDEIMKKFNLNVIEGYHVSVTENNEFIYITQRVLNLLFEAQSL